MNHPTPQRLRLLLWYDEPTGALWWKRRAPGSFVAAGSRSAEYLCNHWNATRASKIAGGLRNGYRRIRIDGGRYTASHIVWALMCGEWPSDQIDHRNGKRADDLAANLRPATNAENAQNKSRRKTNRSGITGIWQKKNKWRAEIAVNGERIYLGMFSSKDLARAAYLAAKSKYHHFQPIPRADA